MKRSREGGDGHAGLSMGGTGGSRRRDGVDASELSLEGVLAAFRSGIARGDASGVDVECINAAERVRAEILPGLVPPPVAHTIHGTNQLRVLATLVRDGWWARAVRCLHAMSRSRAHMAHETRMLRQTLILVTRLLAQTCEGRASGELMYAPPSKSPRGDVWLATSEGIAAGTLPCVLADALAHSVNEWGARCSHHSDHADELPTPHAFFNSIFESAWACTGSDELALEVLWLARDAQSWTTQVARSLAELEFRQHRVGELHSNHVVLASHWTSFHELDALCASPASVAWVLRFAASTVQCTSAYASASIADAAVDALLRIMHVPARFTSTLALRYASGLGDSCRSPQQGGFQLLFQRCAQLDAPAHIRKTDMTDTIGAACAPATVTSAAPRRYASVGLDPRAGSATALSAVMRPTASSPSSSISQPACSATQFSQRAHNVGNHAHGVYSASIGQKPVRSDGMLSRCASTVAGPSPRGSWDGDHSDGAPTLSGVSFGTASSSPMTRLRHSANREGVCLAIGEWHPVVGVEARSAMQARGAAAWPATVCHELLMSCWLCFVHDPATMSRVLTEERSLDSTDGVSVCSDEAADHSCTQQCAAAFQYLTGLMQSADVLTSFLASLIATSVHSFLGAATALHDDVDVWSVCRSKLQCLHPSMLGPAISCALECTRASAFTVFTQTLPYKDDLPLQFVTCMLANSAEEVQLAAALCVGARAAAQPACLGEPVMQAIGKRLAAASPFVYASLTYALYAAKQPLPEFVPSVPRSVHADLSLDSSTSLGLSAAGQHTRMFSQRGHMIRGASLRMLDLRQSSMPADGSRAAPGLEGGVHSDHHLAAGVGRAFTQSASGVLETAPTSTAGPSGRPERSHILILADSIPPTPMFAEQVRLAYLSPSLSCRARVLCVDTVRGAALSPDAQHMIQSAKYVIALLTASSVRVLHSNAACPFAQACRLVMKLHPGMRVVLTPPIGMSSTDWARLSTTLTSASTPLARLLSSTFGCTVLPSNCTADAAMLAKAALQAVVAAKHRALEASCAVQPVQPFPTARVPSHGFLETLPCADDASGVEGDLEGDVSVDLNRSTQVGSLALDTMEPTFASQMPAATDAADVAATRLSPSHADASNTLKLLPLICFSNEGAGQQISAMRDLQGITAAMRQYSCVVSIDVVAAIQASMSRSMRELTDCLAFADFVHYIQDNNDDRQGGNDITETGLSLTTFMRALSNKRVWIRRRGHELSLISLFSCNSFAAVPDLLRVVPEQAFPRSRACPAAERLSSMAVLTWATLLPDDFAQTACHSFYSFLFRRLQAAFFGRAYTVIPCRLLVAAFLDFLEDMTDAWALVDPLIHGDPNVNPERLTDNDTCAMSAGVPLLVLPAEWATATWLQPSQLAAIGWSQEAAARVGTATQAAAFAASMGMQCDDVGAWTFDPCAPDPSESVEAISARLRSSVVAHMRTGHIQVAPLSSCTTPHNDTPIVSRCSSDVGATLPTRSAFEAAGSSEDSATAAAAEVALHRHAAPAAAAAGAAGKVVPGAPHLPTVILSRSCSEGSAHTMQSSGSGSGMNAAAAAAHIPVTLLLGLDTRYFTADAAEDAVTACLTLPSPATFVQGCRESTALCASARASEC